MKRFWHNLQILAAPALLILLTAGTSLAQPTLREKIGQMIMVGFSGTEPGDTLTTDLTRRNLGGTILFGWNCVSPAQVRAMTDAIRALAATPPFIAIDEEGGYVARLNERNGYGPTYSAYKLGTVFNSEDSTRKEAAKMAGWLQTSGINVNLAPVVDVNVNPNNPIIARYERSFSHDPNTVARHASWFVDEFHKRHIICTLKHFPGHGSSRQDSHLGFTDISDTWSPLELIPYQVLIGQGFRDFVMTGHLYNAQIDSLYPATLSYAAVTELLREQLGFEGVVVSDEMLMGAITRNYTFTEAVTHAVLAGVDILLYSTNIVPGTGQSLVRSVIDTLVHQVYAGVIPESRIDESYQRILRLKERYLQYTPPALPPENPFVLSVFPNPARSGSATVRYHSRFSGLGSLAVFDVLGRKVREIESGFIAAGDFAFTFSTRDLPSGIYFVRLALADDYRVEKLIVTN